MSNNTDTVMGGKRVKCYGCRKHIHLDRFAGIAKAKNGRTVYTCDALPCLLKFSDMTEQRGLEG